jgi:hypothetical protein
LLVRVAVRAAPSALFLDIAQNGAWREQFVGTRGVCAAILALNRKSQRRKKRADPKAVSNHARVEARPGNGQFQLPKKAARAKDDAGRGRTRKRIYLVRQLAERFEQFGDQRLRDFALGQFLRGPSQAGLKPGGSRFAGLSWPVRREQQNNARAGHVNQVCDDLLS